MSAAIAVTLAVAIAPAALGQSLVAQAVAAPAPASDEQPRTVMASTSLFAISSPEVREFRRHDLVQIIVRETSKSKSREKMDNKKDWSAGGQLTALPLNSWSTDLPAEFDIETGKRFKGDGKFDREDELTARVTAEVIEILPNGNLVLEARSVTTTNNEATTIRLTGICRPVDVSAANTILSSQIHDLRIEKEHSGDLRENGQRGILARVVDAIFAF